MRDCGRAPIDLNWGHPRGRMPMPVGSVLQASEVRELFQYPELLVMREIHVDEPAVDQRPRRKAVGFCLRKTHRIPRVFIEML